MKIRIMPYYPNNEELTKKAEKQDIFIDWPFPVIPRVGEFIFIGVDSHPQEEFLFEYEVLVKQVHYDFFYTGQYISLIVDCA
jgi:hypothetical protein